MKGRTVLYSGVVAAAFASNVMAGDRASYPGPFVDYESGVQDVMLVYGGPNIPDITEYSDLQGPFISYKHFPLDARHESEQIVAEDSEPIIPSNLLPNAISFFNTLSTASTAHSLASFGAAGISWATGTYLILRRRREEGSFKRHLENARGD